MMPALESVIRPGEGILVGQACAEPQSLLEALVERRDALKGCRLFLGIHYSGILRPEHADCLRFTAYCGIGKNRALADAGVLDILPVPYSMLGPLIRSGKIPADVVLLQVSPPNAHGEYSLGLAADYLVPALQTCRAIVAEVNDQVPWTHSERLLKKEDFALLVESSRAPAQPPSRTPSAIELAIARNAAGLIPPNSVLEFGIGTLPDAVCVHLKNHENLSIHSGTIGDGVVELNVKANCAMMIGTRKLFDHARENPRIRLRSSEYTHDARVLARIDRFCAINSAVEVDLTGQINGEVAQGSYVGAVGGALDFVRAANQSPGGVSLTLLPAARIVERLSGPVATPRSEAGIVVTEHGAADLRGCSLRERERRLLKVKG